MSLSFDPAVLERVQVERIAGYYERALRRMADDIDALHHEQTLLSEAESGELLVQFNPAATSYPSDRLVHELFEEQVQRTPDAVAVMYQRESLTYAQINGQANQLAHYLVQLGVGPEQVVGVCQGRSVEQVVSVLAVLKAGGAYLPLDPTYPGERLSYMLQDAGARLVLVAGIAWMHCCRGMCGGGCTARRCAGGGYAAGGCAGGGCTARGCAGGGYAAAGCAGGGCAARDVRGGGCARECVAWIGACAVSAVGWRCSAREPGVRDLHLRVDGGVRKGVGAIHRSLVNRVYGHERIAWLKAGEVCCQKTAVGFVDAVFERLGALLSGCRVVIADEETGRDAQQLLRLLRTQGGAAPGEACRLWAGRCLETAEAGVWREAAALDLER